MNSNIKDKSAFVVTLLAAALAFASFKDELSSINISLGFYQLNFLRIIIIFFIILTLSAYCYALDYIRYGYGEKIQNIVVFKWVLPFANFLYVIALLLPLAIFVIWLVNLLVQSINIPSISSNVIIFIVSIMSALMSTISSLFVAKMLTKNVRQLSAEKLNLQGEHQFQKAQQLYKKQFYTETIMELFKVVELNIRKKFEEKGYITKYLNPSKLRWIAEKEKIINSKNIAGYEDLRGMRNNAAHNRISYTKDNADSAFEIVKGILDEIDKS